MIVLQFLCHLLPILSSTFILPTTGKIMTKILPKLDLFLPFRQHAPSLANARCEIYADIAFPGEDGAGFFNVLAFRSVFFGSPFVQSNQYWWFNTFANWKKFHAEGIKVAKKHSNNEEKYYVKWNCYGQTQIDHSTKLLSKYWDQCLLWNAEFNKLTKPTITEVFKWLTKSFLVNGKTTTLFCNIGRLSALLICGDLIEAGMYGPWMGWADICSMNGSAWCNGKAQLNKQKCKQSRCFWCIRISWPGSSTRVNRGGKRGDEL